MPALPGAFTSRPLRMRERKYIYNTETYRYEEYRPDPRAWMRKLTWALGSSVVLAVVLLLLNAFVWPEPYMSLLRNRQTNLHQQMMDYRLRLQQVDLELQRIHHADQTYFRSILNLKRMPQATWDGVADSLPMVAPDLSMQVQVLNERLQHRFALQRQSMESLHTAAMESKDELRHVPTLRPAVGRILSGFGYRRDPIAGGVHFHPGLDFHGQYGDKIFAVADGTIITASFSAGGYGLEVEIDHGFGYVTKYAHMSRTNVKVGQHVKRKDVIGFIGNTGYSVGPHLHYEIIRNGVRLDPLDYVLTD